MNNDLEKCSIWIVKDKQSILKKYQSSKLICRKIISLDELKKKYYFNYDKRAIYYLMKNFNYQYDVSKMYLSNLMELSNNNDNFFKVKKLIQIKNELLDNGLLIINPMFKEFLKNKKIAVYNIKNLSSFDSSMLQEIEKYSDVYYINDERSIYHHTSVIECSTLDKEVSYVATKISILLHQGIDIKRIKVCASEEYEDAIQRIFCWFKIPVSIDNNNLYSTEIGQSFLTNLHDTREESLKWFNDHYSLSNPKNLEVYNLIIHILNEYTWCLSLKDLKPFLKEDFEKTTIRRNTNENVVQIVDSLDNIDDDDFVFLVGFNQGEIPKPYKDEDYFTDEEKKTLGLDTSFVLNKRNYDTWLAIINGIKNLVITMKKNGDAGECYISSLNDDLQLELIPAIEDYHYSNLYNKLELSKKIDTLIKYNEIEDDLDVLYGIYPKINYGTYDNSYHFIDKDRIQQYLNHQLTISYSSMNTYYQCAFRYYLSNILKLNMYEETFYTILGNLFHHILSLVFINEIDVKEEYNNYLRNVNYSFNEREKYFLNSLEHELEFIIQTINKQNEGSKLTHIYTEEKIEIPKQFGNVNIIFKGFVDKMMLNTNHDELAIIDYKTGNPNLNLNNIIYGLDLQLPVYVYLAKYKFPNARIVGFYLQKILNTEIIKDGRHSYLELKEDKLKLQGYSNVDLSLLKEMDPNYENSNMIKGMKTTSKGLSTKKVLDDVKIDKLIAITEEKINESIQEILNANFSINPKRVGMDNLGCQYCNFKDICFMNEKNIVNFKEYKNMDFLGSEENDTIKTN